MGEREKIYLIDGSAFVYRAFFAIRGLTDSTGRPTNAVFGFARAMLKLLREESPTHMAVVFDAPGKTFRDDMYPAYKATRPKTPEELIAQIPLIDRLVASLNLRVLRIEGVEADDVLGTLARRAEDAGMDAVIVTGDKDALQLVTEHVAVYDPHKGDSGLWYRPGEVAERFGVPPARVVDTLALMGDASDNVPGVRGIGEKTARKLLEAYGSLDGIYEHLDELKGKQRENLAADHDTALLSRQLVTIRTDVALDIGPRDCRCSEADKEGVAALLGELEFRTLLEEFLPDASQQEDLDYRLILTKDALTRAVAEMRRAGTFAVDTETTSTDPMRATLVGLSMCSEAGKAYYVPLAHTSEALACRPEEGELFSEATVEMVPLRDALDILRPLIEDESIGKVGHNIKYDLIVFARTGVQMRGIVLDTMVASYLTDPSRMRHNLGEVSLHYLKRKTTPITDLIGKGVKAVTFDHVPVDQACDYACEDADVTWRLARVFHPLLRERDLVQLFDDVELPLIEVLARMEMAGVAIDVAVFDELRREIEVNQKDLEGQIFEEAGEPFQVNSPKQLQGILFGKLGLKPIRKTKTGFSTDMDVLEQLARVHTLPAKILEFRGLEKLRNTYVEALPRLVHPETGRIHTSFNQAVAATGRLSSSDPNLQNIPVRTEIGRRIRQGFVPGQKGYRLISADYSQIELRILAHLSGDENLKRAFQDDLDIHRITAARAFETSADKVTPEMRRQAKAVNFGIIYGISPFGLARNLDVTTAEAARFIEHYFDLYPGVRQWIEDTLAAAREEGYVTTILKRRRYVPELKSSDGNARKAAERVAINTPVQGSAADVIKLAMLGVEQALRGTGGTLLLQVHDELLVEAPTDEAERVAAIMKEAMEGTIQLDVPLKADVGVGEHWAEIH